MTDRLYTARFATHIRRHIVATVPADALASMSNDERLALMAKVARELNPRSAR